MGAWVHIEAVGARSQIGRSVCARRNASSRPSRRRCLSAAIAHILLTLLESLITLTIDHTNRKVLYAVLLGNLLREQGRHRGLGAASTASE
jgi:hypothetical protein